jgi:hypothetical protein
LSTPYVAYAAAAGQRDFDVPFPFINRSHVKVRVNGTLTTPLSWPTAARLRLPNEVSGGAVVEIERETPIEEQLVQFQDGNILTAEDLNKAVQQILYRQQEVSALYDRSLRAAQVRVGDNLGIVTNPEDVAQELAELVLEEDVLNEFRSRIADIDLNADSIIAQALNLDLVDGAVDTLRTDFTGLAAIVDNLLGGDPGSGIATLIAEERQERIDGDNALASTFNILGARSGDNLSFILDTSKTRVSPTESLAQRFSALSATDASNTALIQTEQTARINGDSALASNITTLGTQVSANAAAIVTEQTARVNGDAAEAAARQALAARVGTAETAIVNEQTARANGDGALSSTLTALTARVTDAEGLITVARADILSEATARASGDGANATSINGLLTRMGTAEAAIVTEQTARVNGDNALASNVSVLSTSLNGNIASVSTLQSSVNGLQARYGVSLDVNGHVTGFVQNNDGTTGSFTVLADRFAIVAPGVSPTVPFEVSGGIVRIKEANIGTLNVSRLNSGILGANITQNGDWNVGTGRIIWDNGSHMKVAGVGFGSANQFIEWFGPKMAISLCSEANAITYLKTNGDAYFGGALSAGVRKNAARTTQVSATASISTGTFGSAGGARTVIVSYESLREVEISGSCDGSGTPSVTIELRRNGTLLSTFNASGSTLCAPGFSVSEPGYWRETLTGSWTFTDTGGGLSPEYTATVTSRPLSTAPSSTIGLISHTQSLGVISTE